VTHRARLAAGILAAVAVGGGCAHSQSPVLYPNAKLKEAGREQADAEIAACRSLADDYVSSGSATAKEVGKDTAVGGLGGAAIGAVAGAVSGGGAGTGAAIGAATGRRRASCTARPRAWSRARSTRASWTVASASEATR